MYNRNLLAVLYARFLFHTTNLSVAERSKLSLTFADNFLLKLTKEAEKKL
jgi:hypothetical protein